MEYMSSHLSERVKKKRNEVCKHLLARTIKLREKLSSGSKWFMQTNPGLQKNSPNKVQNFVHSFERF